MSNPSIILILPAYNEQDALPPLLAEIAAVRHSRLPNLSVMVVDDGSHDDTAHVVRAFDTDWVTLVPHTRNMGLAQAMRTGIATALAASPPDGLIASMDADHTHQPAELTMMLEKIESGLDVVIASRLQPGARMTGIPLHRQAFSWGVSVLLRLFTPIPGVRDFSCGYRLYRSSVLRRALRVWGDRFITEQGFACMTEILLKLARLPGVTFGETAMVLRYDRKPGPTKMQVWQNIRDMLALTWRHRLGAPSRIANDGRLQTGDGEGIALERSSDAD